MRQIDLCLDLIRIDAAAARDPICTLALAGSTEVRTNLFCFVFFD
jgi:hypothetical protein